MNSSYNSTKWQRIIPKIFHMEGREWGGNFTPSEIILVSESPDIMEHPDVECRQSRMNSVQRAKEKTAAGVCFSTPFYFMVRSNSDLENILREKKTPTL